MGQNRQFIVDEKEKCPCLLYLTQIFAKRQLCTSYPVILKHLAGELIKRRPKKNLEDLEFFDLLAEEQELPAYMKLPSDEPEANNENESDFSDSNSESEFDDYYSDAESEFDDSEDDSNFNEFVVELNPNNYFDANSDDEDYELNFVGLSEE